MSAQSNPIESLSYIAANVDKFNRGGTKGSSAEVSKTNRAAHAVLAWLVSISDPQDSFGDDYEKNCSMLSERGKKIYLQAQNLPVSADRELGPIFENLRAVLLCLGSMLLARFKTNLAATQQLQLFLKLSSAASDVSHVAATAAAAATGGATHDTNDESSYLCWQMAEAHCCAQAIGSLQKLDLGILAQCVSTRDIEQAQLAAMHEYLRAARIVLTMNNPPGDIARVIQLSAANQDAGNHAVSRECLQRAALALLDLPAAATISFCEAVLGLSEEYLTKAPPRADRAAAPAQEVTYMLCFAIERLELCLSTNTAAAEEGVGEGVGQGAKTAQRAGVSAPRPQTIQTAPLNAASIAAANAVRLNMMFALVYVKIKIGEYRQALELIEKAEKYLVSRLGYGNGNGNVNRMAIDDGDPAAHDHGHGHGNGHSSGENEMDQWRLGFLVPYAKFNIHASAGQWGEAKAHLIAVIRSQADIEICLELVQRYIAGHAHSCPLDTQRELFQLCVLAFPQGPARSEALLARLKAIFITCPASGENSAPTKEALLLAHDIITAHLQGKNALEDAQFLALCSLLRSRLSYCLAASQWSLVERWAGLLLLLAGFAHPKDLHIEGAAPHIRAPAVSAHAKDGNHGYADPFREGVGGSGSGSGSANVRSKVASMGVKSVLLLRAHARIQMKQFQTAQEDCEKAWTLEPGPDTALACFQSALQAILRDRDCRSEKTTAAAGSTHDQALNGASTGMRVDALPSSSTAGATAAAVVATASPVVDRMPMGFVAVFLQRCEKLRTDRKIEPIDLLELLAQAARLAREGSADAADAIPSLRGEEGGTAGGVGVHAFSELLHQWLARYEQTGAWRHSPQQSHNRPAAAAAAAPQRDDVMQTMDGDGDGDSLFRGGLTSTRTDDGDGMHNSLADAADAADAGGGDPRHTPTTCLRVAAELLQSNLNAILRCEPPEQPAGHTSSIRGGNYQGGDFSRSRSRSGSGSRDSPLKSRNAHQQSARRSSSGGGGNGDKENQEFTFELNTAESYVSSLSGTGGAGGTGGIGSGKRHRQYEDADSGNSGDAQTGASVSKGPRRRLLRRPAMETFERAAAEEQPPAGDADDAENEHSSSSEFPAGNTIAQAVSVTRMERVSFVHAGGVESAHSEMNVCTSMETTPATALPDSGRSGGHGRAGDANQSLPLSPVKARNGAGTGTRAETIQTAQHTTEDVRSRSVGATATATAAAAGGFEAATAQSSRPCPAFASFFRLNEIAGDDQDYLDRGRYTFAAPLSTFTRLIVQTLQTVSRISEKATSEHHQQRLGSYSDALWLADLCWDLANLLTHKNLCYIPEEAEAPGGQREGGEGASMQQCESAKSLGGATSEDVAGIGSARGDIARLLTAAQLCELAERFYQACMSYEEGGLMHYSALYKNQRSCLLVGAASRLDACDLQMCQRGSVAAAAAAAAGGELGELGQQHYDAASSIEGRLSSAGVAAKRAFDMLRTDGGFQDPETAQLRRMSLLLLFTVLCRGCNIPGISRSSRSSSSSSGAEDSLAKTFVEQHIEELRLLDVGDLLRLATVAAAGPCCPAAITYSLLQLASERCLHMRMDSAESNQGMYEHGEDGKSGDDRSGDPDRRRDLATAADILCRLLLLAPSTSTALEHIKQLVSMCVEGGKKRGGDAARGTDAAMAVSSAAAGDRAGKMHFNTRREADADADTEGSVQSDVSDADVIPVRCETADQATAATFNYGMTLSDLGQFELAEKFLAQATSLLPYCSGLFRRAWFQRMENAYFKILQSLLPQQGKLNVSGGGGSGDSGGRMSTFGLTPRPMSLIAL